MEKEIYTDKNYLPVSVGNWIVTLILLFIPIVNVVMMLIWAFTSRTPISKSNFAKAALIVWIVGTIIVWIFWGSISSMMMRSFYYPPY